jgi:hypothetical protein
MFMSFSEKISKIQALIERASSEGERQAAIFAKERILKRQAQEPIEYRLRLRSPWQKNLFLTLCKKYGLHTYRYPKQSHNTAMVRAAPALMDELLVPELDKYSDMLKDLIQEVLDAVLAKIEHGEEEIAASAESGVSQELVASIYG